MRTLTDDPYLKSTNVKDPAETQDSFGAVSNQPILRHFDTVCHEDHWGWSKWIDRHRPLQRWNSGTERWGRLLEVADESDPNERVVVGNHVLLDHFVAAHGLLNIDYQGIVGRVLGTGTELSNGEHRDGVILVSGVFGHLLRLRLLSPSRKPPVRPLDRLRISHSGLADRLDDLAELKPDWDGYGARVVSAYAIESCAVLLNEIEGLIAQTDDPFIAPMADGGIEIDWKLSGIEIMLVIPSGGTWVELLASYEDGNEKEKIVSISRVNAVLHSL